MATLERGMCLKGWSRCIRGQRPKIMLCLVLFYVLNQPYNVIWVITSLI